MDLFDRYREPVDGMPGRGRSGCDWRSPSEVGGTALLVVVPVAGATVTAQSIAAYLEGKIAKWWMPDDIVFVDALSYGATGKIQKMELRRRFAGHYSSMASSTA